MRRANNYNTQIIRENSRNSWQKRQTNKLRATQITPPNSALIPREQSEKQTTTTHKKFVIIRVIRGKRQTNKLRATQITLPNSALIPRELRRGGANNLSEQSEEPTATHWQISTLAH
jgi:hypothetical protein